MLKQYIKLLYSWKLTIIAMASFGLLLGLGYSFLQPMEYKAESGLLILPRTTIGLDAYSAIKTSERIGENLIQIMGTTSFFEKVQETDYGVDFSYFPLDDEVALKEKWLNSFSAYVKYNSGLMYISVFHEDKEQAVLLAQAINSILIHDNAGYLPQEGFIEIKLVDKAIADDWPARPNFIKNSLALSFALLFLTVVGIIITSKEFRNSFVESDNKKDETEE